jgi:transcriptional regulator with XRE-family HTH domain
MEVLTRIENLLKGKKISKKDFLSSLGFNRSTWGNWERGVSKTYYNNLAKIADYFNVSADYLLGRGTNFINGSVSGNAIVQGINRGNVNINGNVNQSDIKQLRSGKLCEEEEELLKIYRKLNLKNRNKLLSLAFELEELN